MVDHLYAPEAAFFGNSDPAERCASRLQRIRWKHQVIGGRADYRIGVLALD